MKSIKEKAEEYVEGYYQRLGISKDEYPVDVVVSKTDFTAGANYVLDAIGDILSHPTQYVNSDKSVEGEMINAITDVIEQLKR